jgi:hypothetical protein
MMLLYLNYIASNGMMIGEERTGKDLEGSSHDPN